MVFVFWFLCTGLGLPSGIRLCYAQLSAPQLSFIITPADPTYSQSSRASQTPTAEFQTTTRPSHTSSTSTHLAPESSHELQTWAVQREFKMPRHGRGISRAKQLIGDSPASCPNLDLTACIDPSRPTLQTSHEARTRRISVPPTLPPHPTLGTILVV